MPKRVISLKHACRAGVALLKHVNHTLEGFDDSDGDEKDLKEYGGFLFEDLKHWVGKLTDFKRKVQRVQYQKAKTRNKLNMRVTRMQAGHAKRMAVREAQAKARANIAAAAVAKGPGQGQLVPVAKGPGQGQLVLNFPPKAKAVPVQQYAEHTAGAFVQSSAEPVTPQRSAKPPDSQPNGTVQSGLKRKASSSSLDAPEIKAGSMPHLTCIGRALAKGSASAASPPQPEPEVSADRPQWP